MASELSQANYGANGLAIFSGRRPLFLFLISRLHSQTASSLVWLVQSAETIFRSYLPTISLPAFVHVTTWERRRTSYKPDDHVDASSSFSYPSESTIFCSKEKKTHKKKKDRDEEKTVKGRRTLNSDRHTSIYYLFNKLNNFSNHLFPLEILVPNINRYSEVSFHFYEIYS